MSKMSDYLDANMLNNLPDNYDSWRLDNDLDDKPEEAEEEFEFEFDREIKPIDTSNIREIFADIFAPMINKKDAV